MDEQRREPQHIRIDELQEQEMYRDNHSHHRQHHCQCQQHHEQEQESDIYSVYTAQNNQGVMLLREKRYLDAANCFCEAVKYVNERSMYNCPRHDDSQSCDGLHCNDDDACYDHRQNESSSPTPTFSHEDDFSDTDESSVTSSVGVESRAPTSNRIDSFYLLLDGENEDDSNCYCNDDLDQCENSSNTRYNQRRRDQTSSLSSSPSNDSNKILSSTSQHESTYVFRNPIIVSKRGTDPTAGRNFFGTATRVHALSDATNTSATATEDQLPRGETTTTETDTTIDKESCAKLSLVSVYNMALTYHLAALDNEKGGGTEKDNRSCLDGKSKRKNKDIVCIHSDSASGLTTTQFPASSSTYEYTRPAKRQRLSNCNNSALSVATTMTPFGECNAPVYNDQNGSSKNSSIAISSTTNSAVDRVLLSQALAYYEIAYRILVSDQRVLVSQAMVILNNIGHIHRLMGNEENAQRCFQRLLTTMIYIQQTGDSRQISHWDFFLKNVIDLMVSPEYSHKRFAPAA